MGGRGSFSSDGSSDAGGGIQLSLFSPPPKAPAQQQQWQSGSGSKTYKTPDTDTFSNSLASNDSDKHGGGARVGGPSHSRNSSMASAVSMNSSHTRSSSGTYPFTNFQPGASYHPSGSSRPPQRYNTPENQVTPPNQVGQLAHGLSAMEINGSDHPALANIHKQANDATRRLLGLKGAVDKSQHVPPAFKQGFDVDIQQVVKNVTAMSKAADALAIELDQKTDELDSLRSMYSSQTMDNDSAHAQIQAEREQIRAEHERIKTMQACMRAEKEEDERVIKALQEQLAGKRHLWMQVRKDPQERAIAMEMLSRSSTPYTSVTETTPSPTPTGPRNWKDRITTSVQPRPPRSGHGPHLLPGTNFSGPLAHRAASGLASAHLRSVHSRNGPGSNRKASGRVISEWGSPVSRGSGGSHRGGSNFVTRADLRAMANHGPSIPIAPPTAVYTGSNLGDPVQPDADGDFSQRLSHLLSLVIRAFCHKYFARPSPEVEPRIRNDSPSLFGYMCEVVYPNRGRKVGESHVSYLLNDDVSRPFLVERLLTQHITSVMLQAEGWQGYEPSVDKEMATLSAKLSDSGSTNHSKTHERQAMVDRQAELVEGMVKHPKWKEFKNYKVNDHYQRFKKLVGPFLPPGPKSDIRDEALFDLFSIAERAWEIAQMGWESRMTYVYLWGETCSKFVEQNHNAVNSEMTGQMLQQRQMRISLVVTPGVTMRDDSRGMNIGTKLVRRADVLVMD
ncbi:hypothetical protein B0T20DRAFT_444422 [Sordaria brevicollis]|uniref:Uncharacterized protein n=1 Tax=Sordaria brevicollis TaxID=83679 RepID=A0AAE0U612_SORBR|nr:hypothetical protein B0T20DRAFT_444422 [Sordaria brevicollis]